MIVIVFFRIIRQGPTQGSSYLTKQSFPAKAFWALRPAACETTLWSCIMTSFSQRLEQEVCQGRAACHRNKIATPLGSGSGRPFAPFRSRRRPPSCSAARVNLMWRGCETWMELFLLHSPCLLFLSRKTYFAIVISIILSPSPSSEILRVTLAPQWQACGGCQREFTTIMLWLHAWFESQKEFIFTLTDYYYYTYYHTYVWWGLGKKKLGANSIVGYWHMGAYSICQKQNTMVHQSSC